MYTKYLEEIGFSTNQAKVYEHLASHGKSTASSISRNTGIQRSLVYIILKELIEQSLITQDNTGKVARFLIADPKHIEILIARRADSLELAKNAYQAMEHTLMQRFSMQSGQPGVRFFSGIDGIRKLYKDINSSFNEEIWIVRSSIRPDAKFLEEINKQVEYQVKNGVKVKIINSSKDSDLGKNIHLDGTRNTQRGIIAGEAFKNPAQIIIYRDKVAFTTFSDPEFTTVLENQDIATTLRSMYQIIWRQSLAETAMHLKKIL